jgi:hypothetical protein
MKVEQFKVDGKWVNTLVFHSMKRAQGFIDEHKGKSELVKVDKEKRKYWVTF